MFDRLIEILKANPRKIVFTEGPDARILEAADRLKKDGFLTPILIGAPEEVKAAAVKGGFDIEGLEIIDPATYPGMDEMVEKMVTLRKGKTIAQLTTAIGVNMPTFAAVYGTKGHIDIPEFKNPTRAVLHLDGQEPVELAHPFEINGFEYEIREAQACAEAGSLQSERMTGQQTIAVMRIMDEIRRQNGFRFPFERKE